MMMKKKIKYPKVRKAADKKECPVCGKLCNARGLKSHLLLAHKLKWNQLTTVDSTLTAVTLKVTPVKPEIARVITKSNLSKSETKKKHLASKKPDVTQMKSAVNPIQQEPVTQVSTEELTQLSQLPRFSIAQMKAIERPSRTEGLIEVTPEQKNDSHNGLRYCAMANSNFKIMGRVHRLDEFKSGKVPVWFYNEVVLIEAEELVGHFDSLKKKHEWNLRFSDKSKDKELR